MLAPARGAKVFVAGEGGVPRELPVWFDGAVLHARFAPPEAGRLTVQVVAEVAGGPRPVLEAVVFADVTPPTAQNRGRSLPGEDARACAPRDGEACSLGRMLDAARASVGLPALASDPELARIARAHANAMVRAGRLAHDAGDGSPTDRVLAAGLQVREVVENVAHAPSIPLAHRALWESPSHRANMLREGMERQGVAVVRDEQGEAWTVELEAR
jgi:hypothetical protein